jgi:hypothetical protein
MRHRSVAARVFALALVMSAPKGRQAQPLPNDFSTLLRSQRTLQSISKTAGLEFNPTASPLVSAHVIVTITDAGLRRSLTPVLGFDYSF